MQTIKLSNHLAFELTTLVERTIARAEQMEQDDATTEFYENMKAIKKSLDDSCPELMTKWQNLQNLMRTALSAELNARGDKHRTKFTQAVDELDKWLDDDGE